MDAFWNDTHNDANFMGGGQKMILKFYELLKKYYDISILTSQKFFFRKSPKTWYKNYIFVLPSR